MTRCRVTCRCRRARTSKDLASFLKKYTQETGLWHDTPKYMVSLLKAYYGKRATKENDYGFDWLPKLTGDHSHFPFVMRMCDHKVDGYFIMGQNPAVGSQNARLQRQALARVKWLVVRDLVEIESASFWYAAPEIERGEMKTEDIATEVFLMPAASHVEKEGRSRTRSACSSGAKKPSTPPGDAKSEAWFIHQLAKRLIARALASADPMDEPLRALDWWYPENEEGEPEPRPSWPRSTAGRRPAENEEAPGVVKARGQRGSAAPRQAARRLSHAQGRRLDRLRLLDLHGLLRLGRGEQMPPPRAARASTATGGDSRGRATGASSTTAPARARRPAVERAQEARLVGREGRQVDRRRRAGFSEDESARLPCRRPGAKGLEAIAGDAPFMLHSDGKAWLYVAKGLADGPMPTHYEPMESPVKNALYPRQTNPGINWFSRPDNKFSPPEDPRFPYVLTTYRLTEHHTTGAMSRFLPHLNELMPELFVEMSVELAAELGVLNGDYVIVATLRGAVEARALVSRRMRPLMVDGNRRIHQVALPYHWGYAGPANVRGGIVNDLLAISGEPNVTIMESKALACTIIPGKMPPGSRGTSFWKRFRRRAIPSWNIPSRCRPATITTANSAPSTATGPAAITDDRRRHPSTQSAQTLHVQEGRSVSNGPDVVHRLRRARSQCKDFWKERARRRLPLERLVDNTDLDCLGPSTLPCYSSK